jgi:hypothetical protein
MTQRRTAVQRLKLGAVVTQAHRLFVTWTTAVVAAPTNGQSTQGHSPASKTVALELALPVGPLVRWQAT